MAATGNLSSAQFDSDPLDPSPGVVGDTGLGWSGRTSDLDDDGDMDVPGALKNIGADFYSNPGLSAVHGGSGDAKVTIAEKSRRVAANTGDTDFSKADLPGGTPSYDRKLIGAGLQGTDIWGRKSA